MLASAGCDDILGRRSRVWGVARVSSDCDKLIFGVEV